MHDGLEPTPREQGWMRLFLALAAFLLLPTVMPFRVIAPVEQSVLLLAPALGACFLVGWWAGGRLALALLWALAAGLVLFLTRLPTSDAYVDLVRGWALLTAAAFGVVCVLGSARPFFPRALAAVGLALLFGLLLLAAGQLQPERARDIFAAQYDFRYRDWAADVQPLVSIGPAAGAVIDRTSGLYLLISKVAAPLFPALLALQSLAACALAWALYHRLARSRIGAPLAPLRQFRFSDLLIWGPALGLTLVVLPTLVAFELVGANLLVFFGALYALRGMGVVAWLLIDASVATTVLAVCLGFVLPPVAAAFSLGLGLTDTWFDWRGRTRAASSGT